MFIFLLTKNPYKQLNNENTIHIQKLDAEVRSLRNFYEVY